MEQEEFLRLVKKADSVLIEIDQKRGPDYPPQRTLRENLSEVHPFRYIFTIHPKKRPEIRFRKLADVDVTFFDEKKQKVLAFGLILPDGFVRLYDSQYEWDIPLVDPVRARAFFSP